MTITIAISETQETLNIGTCATLINIYIYICIYISTK